MTTDDPNAVPAMPKAPKATLAMVEASLSDGRSGKYKVVNRVDRHGIPKGTVIILNETYDPRVEGQLKSAVYLDFDMNDELLYITSWFKPEEYPISELENEPPWAIEPLSLIFDRPSFFSTK